MPKSIQKYPIDHRHRKQMVTLSKDASIYRLSKDRMGRKLVIKALVDNDERETEEIEVLCVREGSQIRDEDEILTYIPLGDHMIGTNEYDVFYRYKDIDEQE